MDDELRAGKNIKTLRKNHNQNQQQVADIFHVDRSSITYIEKCSGNGISEAKLKSFESYYMTSTSEILYVDLPRIENARADRTSMYSRIEAYFPYVASKDAMKNRMFKRACSGHKKIYDRIKKGDFTGFREIPQFLNMYKTAYEDSRSSNESAVNHTALFYLYAAITDITSHILMGRPASFSKGYETKDLDKRTYIPDDIIREMESVAGFLRSTPLPIEDEKKNLHDYLGAMSHPTGYVNLGFFYLASGYVYNLIDRGKSPEHNRSYGIDLMYSLYLMKNPYAKGFFNL